MIGITGYGAYVPRARLQRKAVAEANAWFAPNLRGAAKGERAMANWDEDAVTMAVEAGRDCLPAADPIKPRVARAAANHRLVMIASSLWARRNTPATGLAGA